MKSNYKIELNKIIINIKNKIKYLIFNIRIMTVIKCIINVILYYIKWRLKLSLFT